MASNQGQSLPVPSPDLRATFPADQKTFRTKTSRWSGRCRQRLACIILPALQNKVIQGDKLCMVTFREMPEDGHSILCDGWRAARRKSKGVRADDAFHIVCVDDHFDLQT